jgi:DNA-binding GntR family transcriptional regulator
MRTGTVRSRGSLTDEACRKIAAEIVVGGFAPESRPDETALAGMFKVSRTPVREALKRLAIMDTGGLAYERAQRNIVPVLEGNT